MKRIVVAAIVCAFALVGTVHAEDTAKRVLAGQLLGAMDMQKMIEKSFEMVKQMVPAQMNQMGASEDALSDKAKKGMDNMMALIMEEMSWDKLKDDYITIYAETFTEEELKGLVDFYNGTIGQKLIAKQPELMKRSMQISQKQMMELMPKIQELTRKLKEQKVAQPEN